MADGEEEQSRRRSGKNPMTIARKYQIELCEKATEENVIVYLETGCGKTHIAVLLIHKLGHLIRKPQRSVCVFLAPTIPLVQQQATVIEDSTDFKVGRYFGHLKRLSTHEEWEKEIEEYEVLVMTPQVLLQNLHHCFIRMELIALLIFDECHHAQIQSSHPYAQIMKEFYKSDNLKHPRIFGMTASPIVGKGGSNEENLAKGINSLEKILDAKVYSVQDKGELASFVASPTLKFSYYSHGANATHTDHNYCGKKLGDIRDELISMLRKTTDDLSGIRNNVRNLQRLHDNLIFSLHHLGLHGAQQVIRILLSGDEFEISGMIDTKGSSGDNSLAEQFLVRAAPVLGCNLAKDDARFNLSISEALEEPSFSSKFRALIQLLHNYREKLDKKCIIFVDRIIVARCLSHILGNLKCLEFWNCHFLVGFHSGLKNISRKSMNAIVEKFRSGKINLLVATKIGEEGLDIQTCCLVIRFDLPQTVASFIQSRGRARMTQSEYVFLVDRENQNELNLIEDFISEEDRMNKEISCRTSRETFEDTGETTYTVSSTGASISEGYSVQLLYHYCSKLPRDEYFIPKPEFFYIDDVNETVCRLTLPPNSPIHQVVSLPKPSKENAKKNVCLRACKELHQLGALSDYLLPGQDCVVEDEVAEFEISEDENLAELHEMLRPSALQVPWNHSEDPVLLNSYYIRFIPIPKDRVYQQFGLFVRAPLPREAEKVQLDLHLARGRIVKTDLVPLGTIEFDKGEIKQAQNFQEMFLKIILDQSEFFSDFVPLGSNDEASSPTYYLLLPVKQNGQKDRPSVDWKIIRNCLSSVVFRSQKDALVGDPVPAHDSLRLANGYSPVKDLVNSLVFCPHSEVFYFVDDVLHEVDAESSFTSQSHSSYMEYYIKKFGIHLSYPKQPLLKAKQLFGLHNLLCNRVSQSKEARELEEHFVELPPELCVMKIMGFSKVIGSSLSLLPSLMHRLENLLVAIELKDIFSASFEEGSEVTAYRILEALTSEKCLERFSLERLEVLGDAFLKYAVGRHLFLLYDTLDEGVLTRKRSIAVNNSNLYNLAIKKNLQVYIRDATFDPSQFFAFGRPCELICNEDTERTIHSQKEAGTQGNRDKPNVNCSKGHQWLYKKTIADVVEALVGAFLVDSGFKAAIAFLKWIGIQVEFNASDTTKACDASKSYMSFSEMVDTAQLENLLQYKFLHKGLLLQATVHPSYNKHLGGCYQRLEFLGDAVLDYLITSYLYSVYPKLKPGQLTDLRSAVVNNSSLAKIAVRKLLHKHLVCDSDSLSKAISEYEKSLQALASMNAHQLQEPKCPKVLGDLVESCIGAILLDSGFNLNCVWKFMLSFFDTKMSLSSLQINPVRELIELCQYHKWDLQFPSSRKGGAFLVETQVSGTDFQLIGSVTNLSKKAATRTGAQEVLSKLQARGYKLKNKSLEDILKSSHKEAARLIGYNETPIKVSSMNSIVENFKQLHVSSTSSESNPEAEATGKEGTNISSQYPNSSELVLTERDQGAGSVEGNNGTPTSSRMTAKSRLYEACTANYWNPPVFECCTEEGPPHLKLFTFKVTVEVRGASNTVLECFGEPRDKKKAAAEHAAEGALWFLQQEGYLRKYE